MNSAHTKNGSASLSVPNILFYNCYLSISCFKIVICRHHDHHPFVGPREKWTSIIAMLTNHWQIQGVPGMRAPLMVQIFHFHADFGKKLQNNGLAYPLGELAPDKENPGFATAN